MASQIDMLTGSPFPSGDVSQAFSGSTDPELIGQGSKVAGTAAFVSNVSMRAKFVNNPWTDNSHMYITEGQLLFVARSQANHDLGMDTVVSVAKVNAILRESFQIFRSALQAGDEDATEFARLLDKYGEKMLECHHKTAKMGGDALAALYAGAGNTGAEMAAFHNLFNKPVLRYLTKLGITLNWNFLGATVTTNRAHGVDAMRAAQETQHVSSVNACVERKATVHNVFAERLSIPTGSDAYLVLTRRHRANGGSGQFEYVPYASRESPRPPISLRVYHDGRNQLDENAQNRDRTACGLACPIGVITSPPRRDSPAALIECALGIGCSAKDAYEITGTLPQMEIQIGI